MSAQGSFRVLLVEDNPRDAELIDSRAPTQRAWWKTWCISKDGEQALDYLRHGGPDSLLAQGLRVMLLDLKLPKLGGLELVARLEVHPWPARHAHRRFHVLARGPRP